MRLLATSLSIAVALLMAPRAIASEASTAKAPAWCAPELEALTSSVCHVDGNVEGRRTLVVFLHGVVPARSTWPWTQERAIAREAKQFHFAAIVPRAPAVGPKGAAGFAWPNGVAEQRAAEQGLIDEWLAAKRTLEARAGRPFDEVFVVGFSSGAYFATSLALRDRFEADGYVVLAGGSPMTVADDAHHRAPIFIGVSARDRATSPGARALGQLLGARAWAHRVDEEQVGHMVSDVHVAHALRYLRSKVDEHASL